MNKIKIFWNKIKERFNAETPRVFKKTQLIAGSISIIAIAINTACVNASAVLPTWWITIFPYLVGFGAGLTALAQFTKTNSSENK